MPATPRDVAAKWWFENYSLVMNEKQSDWKRLSRDERKERKERIKKRKQDADEAFRKKYGSPIASGAFGWTLVEVYQTGHVRVGGGAMLQLYGIEFTDLSARKNQIGRVIGFIGTLGVNMATSSRKGEGFLSISTESGVKTLKTGEVRPSDVETATKLMAAAKAVVLAQEPTGTSAGGTEDIASQLEKLVVLQKEGAITQEEFSAAKKKLLG